MSLIHFFPQMAHVDIDDIGESLETFVPDVLDDHRAGEHPTGVGREVLQQGVLFRRQLDALARALDLLREAIDFEVSDPQHMVVADRGRRSSALTRTSNSANANGLVR